MTVLLFHKPLSAATPQRAFYDSLRLLEKKHGGRLGVALVDTAEHSILSHRGHERFALCSTFKVLAAAFTLSRVVSGREKLSRKIVFQKDDLVEYSPETGKHAGKGMSIADLCKAAVEWSDNTAGNLLLDSFGGPAALTRYLRSLGDEVTRLDRQEPDLNDVPQGELRDTTTPLAMARTLEKILTGESLQPASRRQMTEWMKDCKTGNQRLRAGLPTAWIVGDKTGTGPRNETNDVAIIYPPGRKPLIATVYYTGSTASLEQRNFVLAEVGRIIAAL